MATQGNVKAMRLNLPDEMPKPMDPFVAPGMFKQRTRSKRKGWLEITEADQQVIATGVGQLVGQFLRDRNGVVRWTFTEVRDGGIFASPDSDEMMSAASQIEH